MPQPPAPRADRRLRSRCAACLALVSLALVAPTCERSDGFVEESWQRARQMDYLRFATATPIQPGSLGNVLAHLEREARDPDYHVPAGAIPDDAWDGIFDKMWRLRDTSDFDALRIVDLLYAFRGHPAASEALWRKAEEALLTFKFWYTDPTPDRIVDGQQVVDDMWYWSENHVLIFRTCEYLTGQRYPDRIFAVTGLPGSEHRDRARKAILEWLDLRARFGFTEWHSNVYYNLDMRPLLSLVEWGDPEVSHRAAMLLDLTFLDLALHLHRGTFGATHGRSYIKDKASADTEDVFDQAKMFFDDTELPYSGPGSTSGAVFARARKYRLPAVIRRIARYDGPMVDTERMNLPLDEVPPDDLVNADPKAPFGLDYDDEANLPYWWSTASQPAWMMLPLTFEVAERENLWDAQFSPFKPLRDIVWNPSDPEGSILFAQELTKGLWPFINESVLKEVNTYTFRTADYMLSTAQDYRKGVRGSQTHTWQATLSERAMVFTQHPSYVPGDRNHPLPADPADWNWQREDEPGPGYWTGEASQPRAAQHRNVAIAIYAPQYLPVSDLGFDYRRETHAYFPVAHMDEVVQQGSWTFGRKDDAWVALYSWRPTTWRSGLPEVFRNAGLDFDLVAPGGADNVWIVECGSRDEWPGGFDAFRAAVAASTVDVTPLGDADGDNRVDGFLVAYDSPSQGRIEFGWDEPLRVAGVEQPIAGYPRFGNPFVHVDFAERRYEIAHDRFELVLDFDSFSREASGPRF